MIIFSFLSLPEKKSNDKKIIEFHFDFGKGQKITNQFGILDLDLDLLTMKRESEDHEQNEGQKEKDRSFKT